MDEAERRIAEKERLLLDLVESDPIFSIFTVVSVDGPAGEGRKFVLVRREDGAGIQMPEPGTEWLSWLEPM
jgi:hypothetical protein